MDREGHLPPYALHTVHPLLDVGVRSLSTAQDLAEGLLRAGALEALTHHLSHPELRAADVSADPAEGALVAFLRVCAHDRRLADWARELAHEAGLDLDACLGRLPLGIPFGHPMASLAQHPQDYELLAVADLPMPHSIKADCAEQRRFGARLTEEQRRSRLRGIIAVSPAGIGRQVRAGTQWQQQVLRDRLWQNCVKHDPSVDWNKSIEVIARVLTEATEGLFDWHRSVVYRRVNPSGIEPLTPQLRLTWSLLGDPITWSPGQETVGNGQHRLCGARAAELTHIWVRTR